MGYRQKKHGILGGVALLTIAGILVKMTGVLYKIPLSHLLGDEGMGYFNTAYTVYTWLYMLSTAGFPVAVSVLVSEAQSTGERGDARHIVKVALVTLLFIGAVGALVMACFATPIAVLLGNPQANLSIQGIAPALLLICIASLFRGCFQGYANMAPTAVSQVVESVGKVGFGIFLASYAARQGWALYRISAMAILGVSLGTLLGCLYLAIRFWWGIRKDEFLWGKTVESPMEHPPVLKKLVGIAIPVTMGASVMSLTSLIDLGMMIRRLQDIGYTGAEATALYGNYTTLVVPMFHLPTIFISPIAGSIMPILSAAHATGDRETEGKILRNAYRFAGAIAVPCSMGLCFLSKPILSILYPAESVAYGFRLLSAVSPGVYFLCVLTLTNSVLQSTGHQKASMWAMGLGAMLKLSIGYLLMGMPSIGIYGVPLGTVICYGVALVVALTFLTIKLQYAIPFSDLMGKALLASSLGIGSATYLYRRVLCRLGPLPGLSLCMGLAVLLYFLMALLLRMIRTDDMRLIMPKWRRKKRVLRPM